MAEVVHTSRHFTKTLKDQGISIAQFTRESVKLGQALLQKKVYQKRDGQLLLLSDFQPLQDCTRAGWNVPNTEIKTGLREQLLAMREGVDDKDFIRRCLTAGLIAFNLEMEIETDAGREIVIFQRETNREKILSKIGTLIRRNR